MAAAGRPGQTGDGRTHAARARRRGGGGAAAARRRGKNRSQLSPVLEYTTDVEGWRGARLLRGADQRIRLLLEHR